MPYFDKNYCDKLVGKTISKIVPVTDPKHHSITIHFTDGTQTKIEACVEQEQVPVRAVTLIVNSKNREKVEKKDVEKIWIITATSESGDNYGPEVLHKKPTDDYLAAWAHCCDSSPERDGPGRA